MFLHLQFFFRILKIDLWHFRNDQFQKNCGMDLWDISKIWPENENFWNFFWCTYGHKSDCQWYQKQFRFFWFFDQIFFMECKRTLWRKIFLLQNFLFTKKKSDVADLRYVDVGIKNWFFSSTILCWLLKTNFWIPSITYFKFPWSNFHSKQKILQQNFFSS